MSLYHGHGGLGGISHLEEGPVGVQIAKAVAHAHLVFQIGAVQGVAPIGQAHQDKGVHGAVGVGGGQACRDKGQGAEGSQPFVLHSLLLLICIDTAGRLW